jgi:Flp pilus assembly protein TadG
MVEFRVTSCNQFSKTALDITPAARSSSGRHALIKTVKRHLLSHASGVRIFAHEQSGSMAMIASLAILPMLGLMGAAVDYSRASEMRARIQLAADSASLAAAGTTGTPSQRAAAGSQVFAANIASLTGMSITPIFTEITNGVRVTVTTSATNAFMQILGNTSTSINITSEAVLGATGGGRTPRVEVALALDTTASMKNDMSALRNSAVSLVDKVMKNSNVYVSVVPYVASVNVGSSNLPMSMMDTNADSQWHAIKMNRSRSAILANCGAPTGGGGGGGGGGGPGGGSVESSWDGCAVLQTLRESFLEFLLLKRKSHPILSFRLLIAEQQPQFTMGQQDKFPKGFHIIPETRT